MSESTTQRRRKSKPAHLRAAQIKSKIKSAKKRKSRPTREYQQNERDVRALMEQTSLSIDVASDGAGGSAQRKDDVSRSLDFFCRINEDETPVPVTTSTERKTKLDKVTGRRGKTLLVAAAVAGLKNDVGAHDDNDDDDDYAERSQSASDDEDSATKSSSVQSLTSSTSPQQQQQNTASTYIQIDAEDVALVQLQPLVKWLPTPDLLYQPESLLPPTLVLLLQSTTETRALSHNASRMLNRFHTESKTFSSPALRTLLAHFCDADGDALSAFASAGAQRYRSQCAHQFHAIFCEPARDAAEIPTRKFVRIYLKELRFTTHPQLLDEHRLSNALEDLYAQHTQRLEERICAQLRAQLQTERKIVNEMLRREAAAASTAAAAESPATQARRVRALEQQLRGVRALRQQLYDEEAASRRLLKQILDTWLQLKSLRKAQAFQCTRYKLRIKVDESAAAANVAADSARWTERFETDLNEIYREELEFYYRAKRLWKAARHAQSGDELRVKPKKPDIAQLSAELRKQLAACLGAPGEPQIDIQLNRASDEEFYAAPMATGSAQRRLRSFYMKIYFDEEFVSATRSYRLTPDLRLSMHEVFGVFLERRLPQQIRIALYEKHKLHAAHKVADIHVPMPQALTLAVGATAPTEVQRVDFSSERSPKVAGQLSIRFQCEEQSVGKAQWIVPAIQKPQETQFSPQRRQLSSGTDAPSHEIAEQADAYTHTPTPTTDNAQLTLTCTFEEELLQFCPLAELQQNRRFRLLRSRYLKNDARTRDLRFIAALENELEFDCNELEEPVIEAGDWMVPIDLHKHEGKKYVKSVYEAIRSQCARLSTAAASAEQLLIGDPPASWSTFFQALALLFNPRRALSAPLVKTSTMLPLSLCVDARQHFRIVLNVVRATGIPIRIQNVADTESRQRSSDSSNLFVTQIYKYSNVRPFIALSYKDKLCRSLAAEGSNPTWNEQLVLQVSGSLADLRDDLKITLFDEVIENHVNDDLSVRNMDIYQRIQTNWLGEYRLPISVLLAQQKLEGAFELNTPKVLLGYKPPTMEQLSAHAAGANVSIEQYPEFKESVRLWCYMSVEPQVMLPQLSTACLECAELKEVRQQLHEWCLQVLELRPQRYIEPLVCTVEGKRVCLTRLLEPVPLPLEASENLLESAARFVAQLNVLKTYVACAGFAGIWLNNQTVLDTTWCAVKDLGVLLCNYLLSIGLQSWLVLGQASAYGECTFVLYRSDEGELLLIDPSTGKRYSIKDVFCTLNQIFLVVAQDNLYCNIQTETRVTMTNFNLHDSSCWLPAFSKRSPAPLGGVQRLNYNYEASHNTFELRRNIERKIMKKISTWRTMRKTIWNRAFQPRLHSILQNLEHLTTFANGTYTEARYADQFAAEFPSYKFYGYTLNFPYTNLTSISERIKSTGIHLNSDKRVEFSLATHIHVYPNNVLSVWIFLISMIPNRPN